VRERDEDRRVRRTKGLLRGALASLVHEKPYDAIAVKEILARADVGRSAFYAHFGDKDALLDSAIRETLRASASRAPAVDPVEAVLGFGGPLLEHVGRALAAGGGPASLARHAAVHQRLRRLLAESVTDALRRGGGRRAGEPPVPVELLAAHVVDTFLRVLAWWVERGALAPARDADRLFRALVAPAVADAVG
jgi:AcrR family transcriptional regulator